MPADNNDETSGLEIFDDDEGHLEDTAVEAVAPQETESNSGETSGVVVDEKAIRASARARAQARVRERREEDAKKIAESNGDQVLQLDPPTTSWLATWKAKVSQHINENYDTLSTSTAGLIKQAEEYIAQERSYKIKDKKVYGGLITFFVVSAALVIERVKANRKFNICKMENETLQLKNDDLKIENDGLKATVSALQKQIAILKAAAVDNQSAANVVRQTATAAAKASANANRAKRTRAKSTSSPASRAPSTKRGRTSRSR